jgi:RNA polymerase sigma factor (sigma-70 family)
LRTANRNTDSEGIRKAQSVSITEKTHRSDIDELISVYADPIIKKVLLQRLNIYFNPQRKALNQPEAEDLYQTVILKLITSLGGRGRAFSTEDIYEVSNYVATITHNVCNDFLRTKYPERNRLKNKLRDLMRRHPDFTWWMVEDRLLCGLVSWSGRPESPNIEKLVAELNGRGDESETNKLLVSCLIRLPLSRLVAELFSRVEGPIEIDQLVYIIARLQGIKDQMNESIDTEDLSALQIADSPGRFYERLELREFLLRLWNACCELPLSQRKAFVFTSSDNKGDSLLHIVLREQAITITKIYQALNMTREDLSAVWERLPMDGSTAAAELGTSTQMIAKWRHRALRKLSAEFGIKK